MPAPPSRLVRVEVNGRFFGLYTEVETIGPVFLSRAGLWGASTFKATGEHGPECDGRPLPSVEDHELYWEGNRGAPYEALRDFLAGLDACQGTDALERFVRANVDVERYVRYLVGTALVSHWDSVARNVVWCFDRRGGKRWFVIPWGVDRTWGIYERGRRLAVMQPPLFGTRDRPLHDGGRKTFDRVRDRVLSVPAIRARYFELLGKLAATELRPEALSAEIDRHLAAAEAWISLDRERWPLLTTRRDGISSEMPTSKAHLDRAAAKLKLYVRDRAVYLARACAEAKAPKTPEERRTDARRELLSLAGLWGGVALCAVVLARRAAA